MKRRDFLKTIIGIIVGGTLPLEKILSKSTTITKFATGGIITIKSEKCTEYFENSLLKAIFETTI